MNVDSSLPKPHRWFIFSGGGWVIWIAVGLTLIVAAWQIKNLIFSVRSHAVGDGVHIESYGFDLSTCQISPNDIVASGMPKDGLPVLHQPPTMTVEEVEELNRKDRSKYLVSGDRVIGVEINHEARAYPLRILNWHEIVNDTLGGRAILVSYNPLCDSAVVYDRKVGDEILEFGFSGLLYNSNTLLYDLRPDPRNESLWIQLLGKAITGKDFRMLSVIPASLVSWRTWSTLHPETTVLYPQPKMRARYKREYGNYFGSDLLRFPVTHLPSEEIPKKTPLIIVSLNGVHQAFSYEAVKKEADSRGDWLTFIGETPIRFHYYSDTPAVTAQPLDDNLQLNIRYAFWFSWYAMNPGVECKH